MFDQMIAAAIIALRDERDFLNVRGEQVIARPLDDSVQFRGLAEPSSSIVDVSAGPMMSASPLLTLVEECRRCVFAIDWLVATEIVRRDPDGTLLLVHDRSGEALRSWADTEGSDPAYALRQLTGARG